MPRPIPQYGVPLDPELVNPELPMYPVYGVTPSNEYIALKTLGDGTLVTSATFTGSITIGSIGVTDKSSFTYGGSLEQPVGGVFNDTGATLTSGTTGALRLTSARGLHTNLRDANGNQLLGQALSAASLPVVLASDQSPIPTSISGTVSVNVTNPTLAVTQSGTWNLNNITGTISLPTGASTAANQTTEIATLSSIESNTANIPPLGQALASGSVPVVLTASQLSTLTPLSTVTVVQPSGSNLHVDVDNFPAIQPVSGTVAVSNFPASQVVTQPTGTNLHTVVDNFPAIQPVSGTVTVDAGTGTFDQNLMEVGGSAFALGQAVSAASLPVVIASDQSPIPVTGTITTSPDVNVHDGSGNSISSTGTSLNVDVTNTVTVAGTITANAGSGTFAISAVSLPLPTGAATSSNQSTANTTLATIAANTAQLAGTQPVSIASNVTIVQPTGTNLHTVVDNFPATQPISGSVSINNFPAVQTISGTVAVSNFPGTVAVTSLPPLPAGGNTIGTVLANLHDGSGNSISSTTGSLNVNVTNPSSLDTVNQGNPNTLANAWPVELSDGTNLLGTSAHPVRIDPTGTTPQPVSQSGAWTTGRTWTLASGTDSVSAVQLGTWNITNITGTVSLPTGAATSANQTNGLQQTQIVDGSDVTVGPVQTLSGTNYLPVVLAASGTPGSAVPVRAVQIAGSDGTNLRALATDTSGHLLVTATANTLPTAAGVGQTKIAVTGTAVQLASNALVNGVILSASTSNSASITVGGSGVTNATDGTGNGFILAPGASVGIAVSNTNELYVNGTAADVVSFVGS